MLVSGVMTLFDLMHSWVFYSSAALSIVATSVIVMDVEKEVQSSRKKNSTEEYSLNFGDDYG